MRLIRATVDIAWELVQQQDQRETSPWRLRPVVQLVGARLHHELAESRPDLLVKGLPAPEPFLAGFGGVEPEGENLVDFGVGC